MSRQISISDALAEELDAVRKQYECSYTEAISLLIVERINDCIRIAEEHK